MVISFVFPSFLYKSLIDNKSMSSFSSQTLPSMVSNTTLVHLCFAVSIVSFTLLRCFHHSHPSVLHCSYIWSRKSSSMFIFTQRGKHGFTLYISLITFETNFWLKQSTLSYSDRFECDMEIELRRRQRRMEIFNEFIQPMRVAHRLDCFYSICLDWIHLV